MLGDASPLDHAVLDRERYRLKEWTNNRDRCQRAGILEDRDFATEPQLAKAKQQRADWPH